MAKTTFPKNIYVKTGGSGKNRRLDAQSEPEGFFDPGEVGIYELVEVKKLKIEKELE